MGKRGTLRKAALRGENKTAWVNPKVVKILPRGYVMPNLAYSLILGKTWMEINNVVYLAK